MPVPPQPGMYVSHRVPHRHIRVRRWAPSLRSGVGEFFCKRPDCVNISGFLSHSVSVAITKSCYDGRKAAIDKVEMNGHDYIPVKFYAWAPKFEFHVIFMCREIVIFF